MNLEIAENIANLIQSVAVSVAALAGTIWAIRRFYMLRKRQAVTVCIEASLLGISGTFPAQLLVKAILRNVGDQTEILNISNVELCVSKVTGFAAHAPEYAEPSYWHHNWPDRNYVSASIHPGGDFLFPFLIPITEAGTYLLRIRCLTSPQVAASMKKEHKMVVTEPGQAEWIGQTFVMV